MLPYFWCTWQLKGIIYRRQVKDPSFLVYSGFRGGHARGKSVNDEVDLLNVLHVCSLLLFNYIKGNYSVRKILEKKS